MLIFRKFFAYLLNKWPLGYIKIIKENISVQCSKTFDSLKTSVDTAWKMSSFGVILVLIIPHLEWIRWDTPYLSLFSPNEDQNNSEYGHFLRSVEWSCTSTTLSKIRIYLEFSPCYSRKTIINATPLFKIRF